MKKVFLALIVGFGMAHTVSADEDIFRRGGGFGNRGNLTCQAQDAGWEEHWGGHNSCRECQKDHGRCIEVCSESYYVCQAEGVKGRGNRRTRVGFEASHSRRWRAEDAAVNRCRRSGAANCRVVRCGSDSEVVSRRGC